MNHLFSWVMQFDWILFLGNNLPANQLTPFPACSLAHNPLFPPMITNLLYAMLAYFETRHQRIATNFN